MGTPTYGQSAIVQRGSEKQPLQLTFRVLCNVRIARSAHPSAGIVLSKKVSFQIFYLRIFFKSSGFRDRENLAENFEKCYIFFSF